VKILKNNNQIIKVQSLQSYKPSKAKAYKVTNHQRAKLTKLTKPKLKSVFIQIHANKVFQIAQLFWDFPCYVIPIKLLATLQLIKEFHTQLVNHFIIILIQEKIGMIF
jgi:hypothetical protein